MVAAERADPALRWRAWFSPLRLQAICVGITFVAMIAGLITSQTEVPAWVPSLCYLIAYLAGGAFGVQAGLESLRQRRVDVDLLMVLAALGAVVLGAPFEARCCSSSSRSPTCSRIMRWGGRAARSRP